MTADHLRFLAIVLVVSTIAVMWCRTFPVGHDRLIWRRLRARLRRPHLRAHDRVACLDRHDLLRHQAR